MWLCRALRVGAWPGGRRLLCAARWWHRQRATVSSSHAVIGTAQRIAVCPPWVLAWPSRLSLAACRLRQTLSHPPVPGPVHTPCLGQGAAKPLEHKAGWGELGEPGLGLAIGSILPMCMLLAALGAGGEGKDPAWPLSQPGRPHSARVCFCIGACKMLSPATGSPDSCVAGGLCPLRSTGQGRGEEGRQQALEWAQRQRGYCPRCPAPGKRVHLKGSTQSWSLLSISPSSLPAHALPSLPGPWEECCSAAARLRGGRTGLLRAELLGRLSGGQPGPACPAGASCSVRAGERLAAAGSPGQVLVLPAALPHVRSRL